VKTVSIQIGNGDDKLSQRRWNHFVPNLRQLVEKDCLKLHFFGAPENWSEQQNVAIIFDIHEDRVDHLKDQVAQLGQQFEQDSVAWTEGRTVFL
jgi:hypothetical protein